MSGHTCGANGNIVVGKYIHVDALPRTLTSNDNVWWSAGAPPTWDKNPINADSRFVDSAKRYQTLAVF